MHWRSNKGFTLPEMLLAALIASFALCGVLLTYISCMNMVKTSKNVSIATSAAQGLIEEIRTTPFPQIVDDYNRLGFVVNGINNSRGIVYVDDTNPELLLVTVSVCWKQGIKTVGEDTNLNGLLDAGEDLNANNMIDSSVELVTQVANR
ncbi:MAG: prepilin-type N-terminal cleavage/methylation domain-containing protein [Candidatus Omnitrophota bacterium]